MEFRELHRLARMEEAQETRDHLVWNDSSILAKRFKLHALVLQGKNLFTRSNTKCFIARNGYYGTNHNAWNGMSYGTLAIVFDLSDFIPQVIVKAQLMEVIPLSQFCKS